jgi:hypothetical protein
MNEPQGRKALPSDDRLYQVPLRLSTREIEAVDYLAEINNVSKQQIKRDAIRAYLGIK